ncbi:MAG: DEAD/DEAH box helicase [Myxococcales bacterium]|nr:MAG: DEAD/DEAH box helicase [Myxococcales bacterium]
MLFDELNLHAALLKAVRAQGYASPTPIQQKAIPYVLAGRDVLGCAQTGTGKTAAFALPILQRLSAAPRRDGRRPIRALALAPTRELASQIGESFAVYGAHTGLRHTVIFGGVGQASQTRALTRGVDILVATPGRLLDLMNQGYVDLSRVEAFILDEADRMLDMGFIPDIRRVVRALPAKRQTLLFSATLPPSILDLAGGLLDKPETVSVAPSATTVERIAQSVYFVEQSDKIDLLVRLCEGQSITRALVFTRTKHGADKLVRKLAEASIPAAAIHGNKSQSRREQALAAFKRGAARVLVATDIASRGLDIDEVSHVVNFDLPVDAESYVHRIGRTARAGASGAAFSFCGYSERPLLASIERLIRQRLDVVSDHPFRSGRAASENQSTRPAIAAKPSQPARRNSAPSVVYGSHRGRSSSSRRPFRRDAA